MRTHPCAAVACFALLVPYAHSNPIKGPALTLSGHNADVYNVAFSPDSKRVASATHSEIKIWDALSGKQISNYPTGGTNVFGLAFSPDGKSIAVGVSKDVRILDAATGQETIRLRCGPHFLFRIAFHPDGKHVAAAGGNNGVMPGNVHVWEVATGKEVFTLAGHSEPLLNVAYSADGKMLASCSGATTGVKPGEVRLWEAATGKLISVLRGHSNNVYGVALSPDGRRAASASGTRAAANNGELKLWETASGKEVLQLSGHTGTIYGVAFSPDGRKLASCASDKMLKVWDVLSGRELFSSADHGSAVYSVAFSPNGKLIATSSQDRSVKLWEVAPVRPTGPVVPLAAAKIDALWSDLAGDDPRKANEAIWALAAVPGQAVPLVGKHVQPVAALTAAQETEANRCLRDLDHRRYPTREQAARTLGNLGEAVVPVLKKALEANPPLEVRRRLGELIETLTTPARTPPQVQALRAVEVLEDAGSTEARELLRKLAAGLNGARLTEEARAALARLDRLASRP